MAQTKTTGPTAASHSASTGDRTGLRCRTLWQPTHGVFGFAAAFENRRTMQTFVSHIAWESEVWIAEDPDHMIHFNGERFLGPYPDVMPAKS